MSTDSYLHLHGQSVHFRGERDYFGSMSMAVPPAARLVQ
jgi:hypothetical protein